MHRDEPLVTIATFPTSFEASLARGALEAAGIPALVPAEDFGDKCLNRTATVLSPNLDDLICTM